MMEQSHQNLNTVNVIYFPEDVNT